MMLTRRAFTGGGAALAAAALPCPPARAEPSLHVRRSIGDLIREQSPLIDSFRRGVGEMMRRDVTDKLSWWFQANLHDLPDEDLAKLRSFAKYWRQCPHKNYFLLSWHRMYLYFFERIVRSACGDSAFALPYWAYDDPRQATLPMPFVPDPDEMGSSPANPPLSRRNPLARAIRLEHVDRRWIGLGDVATDVTAALALDRFATDDKLEARKAFGGVRSSAPREEQAAGGLESTPHNLVHKTIGLQGDMGATETAARDPIFWLHHANIDRLWVRWTDAARGRIPPVDDEIWMKIAFTFIDEDGQDRVMTGAEVLDTQFQLGYRYDDDPERASQLDLSVAVARAPADPSAAEGLTRMHAAEPVLLARGAAVTLAARESHVVLAGTPRPGRSSSLRAGGAPRRLRVVLKDVVAGERTPPYDVFLLLEAGSLFDASTSAVRIGGLDLFGGAGRGSHAHGGETIALEATDAVAQLSRQRGFDMKLLRVSIVRRAFPSAAGGEFVPADADPPRIGAIELIQS